jgi:hypothetical protein
MNLGEEAQVKQREKEVGKVRALEINDIRSILLSPSGRRFLWRLIAHCRILESIWEQSAKIHYNAGRQDVGHFIWSELEAADKELVFQMMREHSQIEEKKND